MIPLERHRPYLVPEVEIRNRLSAFQKILQDLDVAAAWIDYMSDRYYFTGSVQDGILIVPAAGEPFFFVRMSLNRAEWESPLNVLPWPGRKGLINQLGKMLGESGRIGLSADVSPASTYLWLAQKTGKSVTDIGMAVKTVKAVKSFWEIDQIRRAAAQADILFGEMANHIRPGIREVDASASIEKRLRELGHCGTIQVRRPGMNLGIIHVVAGDSALYPTNFDGPVGAEGLYPSSVPGSGSRTIGGNETVTADMVTAFNGYHADDTRIFFTGKTIPDRVCAAHDYCLEVVRRLEERIGPGRICQDVHNEVQAWVDQHESPEGFMGFGENRVKFFGHGIGLELDEFPIIANRIDMELKQGMVLAMEPKAFLKGVGGVGIENTYLVTETGCESFCKTDEEITIVF